MTNLDATSPVDWDRAIDHVSSHGRCRGEYMLPDGSVCAMGAGLVGAGLAALDIGALTCGAGSSHPQVQRIATVLAPIVREQFPDRSSDGDDAQKRDWHRVAYFNDNPTTSDEDVILVLEKARGSSWA